MKTLDKQALIDDMTQSLVESADIQVLRETYYNVIEAGLEDLTEKELLDRAADYFFDNDNNLSNYMIKE